MNSEPKTLIDRMVDGELDDEQQRELLLSCEQRRSWRELALAYVESQTLGRELTQLMEEEKPVRSESGVGRNRPAGERSRLDWRPLSLAAAILVSLGVGYGLGWMVQDSPDAGIVAKQDGAAEDDGDAQLSSMQFTIRDSATDGLRQVDLPILKASDLGPNWLQQLEKNLPEDYVQQLRGRGLDIKRTRTLTPIDLGDGRRVVIPIDYFIEHRYQ